MDDALNIIKLIGFLWLGGIAFVAVCMAMIEILRDA